VHTGAASVSQLMIGDALQQSLHACLPGQLVHNGALEARLPTWERPGRRRQPAVRGGGVAEAHADVLVTIAGASDEHHGLVDGEVVFARAGLEPVGLGAPKLAARALRIAWARGGESAWQ
jgi:hypothetical protein